jgi:glucose/arabinose dehydrogenase
MIFSNPVGPGWADKAGSFADPRPEVKAAYNVPAGGSEMTREGQPMPKEWIDYHGHYLHGDEVVLSYAVNGCAILERPVLLPGSTTLARELTVAPTTAEQRVHLAGKGVRIARLPAPGTRLETMGEDQVLVLEPFAQARTVIVSHGEPPVLRWEAPQERTRGGPARWQQTVITQGALGTGDGAYVVDTLTPPDENPWKSWIRFGGVDFFPDGKRAALCTWSGDVWIVSGIDGELKTLTWKRYAAGLYQPLGIRIVGDDILCTCRDRIVRLHDLDGDGEADFYESFNSDMHLTRHFHEFALDLQSDAAGNLYFAKGGTPGRGGPNFDLWSIHNSCFFKLSPDGKRLEVVARGLRAPNGIGIGPHGEMVSGDNQGSWVPVCPINRIRPGAFVGIPDAVPGAVKPTRRDPPIVWLPMDVDNSSGCQVWVPDGRWGPFAGQMLHLSYGKSSLFAVMTQTVGDVLQGAVTRFPLTFASGIMRARFNPADGQLYVCGLKGWQTNGAKDGTFQRVRFTGQPVRMPIAWAVTRQGVDLTFTAPLDKAAAEDAGSYAVEQFNVLWSASYGSPEFSVSDPQKKSRDKVEVTAARLSADGRTVALTIPGIGPANCHGIKLKITAADGTPIATTVWGTINALP